MCLTRVYAESTKKRLLRKKPEWFTVYKVVGNEEYEAQFNKFTFHAGLNKAEQKPIHSADSGYYTSGFHAFLSKGDAKIWLASNFWDEKIVSCKVHRPMVTNYGSQYRCAGSLRSIVCSHIVMPCKGQIKVLPATLRKAKREYAKLTS